MERIDNLPVLNDEFADRYCELQQELAQLRNRSAATFEPDEKTLRELKELNEKLAQEQQQRAAAERSAREWRDKYESGAARINELEAQLSKKKESVEKLQEEIRGLREASGPTPLAGTGDVEDLRRQLTDALIEKSRWKRNYDECQAELDGKT